MPSLRFPRKLQFSQNGQQQALKVARRRYGVNYKAQLALQTDLHRHTIANCLDKGDLCTFDTFDRICEALDLDWAQVSEPGSYVFDPANAAPESAIESLVSTVRQQVARRIEDKCGSIQMSSHRMSIDCFVEPSLFKVSRLPSEQFSTPSRLTGAVDEETFNRTGILTQHEGRTDGSSMLLAGQRLLIYASPGCGKTSYLKWLATRCNRGVLLPNCVPVFVEMRYFAPQALQMSLYTYIEQYFQDCGVREFERVTRTLFMEGRIFLIVDGLDEVQEAVKDTVNLHVAEIIDRYYQGYCAFSCRLPLELPFADKFQKAIIAPFTPKQRTAYINHWFSTSNADPGIIQQFLDRLKRHVTYGELTRTPLLLDLLCRIFRDHQEFPSTRAGVYDLGLESLLKEEARRLRISSELKLLSIDGTRDLMQKIAAEFFLLPQPQTLFERREVERKIRDYFAAQDLPSSQSGSFSVSKVVEDLELAYGLIIQQASNLCSFSHLTFQEYFTAEHLINTHRYAIAHDQITNPQWRFVIELVAELLRPEQVTDFFEGFKQRLDALVMSNDKVRQFLTWVDQMAASVSLAVDTQVIYKQTLLRAWYFVFSLEDVFVTQNIGSVSNRFEFPDFDFATSIISSRTLTIHSLFYQAYHMTATQPVIDEDPSGSGGRFEGRSYRLEQAADARHSHSRFRHIVDRIYTTFERDPALENHFAGWKTMIQSQMQQHHSPEDWWQHRRKFWRSKVCSFMESRYNLQCNWDFTENEKVLLRRYYNATKLLSICINRAQTGDRSLYPFLCDNMLRIVQTDLTPEEPFDDYWRG